MDDCHRICCGAPAPLDCRTRQGYFARTRDEHEQLVNVDLIAGSTSPLRPEFAAVTAGRLVLHEFDRLAAAKTDFAFENTLSGLRDAKRFQEWKSQDFSIEIKYIRLPSPPLALRRVTRLRQANS
jgi:predicted ABC-type ATPase